MVAKVLKIGLNDETINHIQRLGYETAMKERIVKQLIAEADNTTVLKSEVFTAYQKELAEVNAEFEIAKSAVINEFLPIGFDSSYKDTMWLIDYNEKAFIVRTTNPEAAKVLENMGYSLMDDADGTMKVCRSCN